MKVRQLYTIIVLRLDKKEILTKIAKMMMAPKKGYIKYEILLIHQPYQELVIIIKIFIIRQKKKIIMENYISKMINLKKVL